MTRPRRAHTPFALVAVAAVVVSGCGGERDDERMPRSVDQSSAAETAGRDEVEDGAAERVYQYVSGRSAIRSNPGTYTDVSTIGFAEGRLATSLLVDAGELAAADRKQVGVGEVTESPTVLEVDLSPEKKKDESVAPYVSLRACVDESDTHVVDAKGKKVSTSEGKGPRPVQFHVLNRKWPSMEGWRVAWIKELKGSC